MLRASRIAPFRLPWIFHWLGPMKWDLLYGKLSGNRYPPRPMIHGEKISFKPTQNLEFGFSRTGELGGVGRPLTLGRLWLSYFSVTSPNHETATNDPGKRIGGFDFSYRVPFARHWLTLYADSLSDDDPSPIDAPRRAGISPGIYMSRIPGVPKLDLRVEAVNTNPPTSRSNGGQYIYYDGFYHDLYTNKNNIIGSWIGREGQGIRAQTTYWFSPRNTLQLGYRHAKVASDFVPGGETINGSVKLDWWMQQDLSVSAFVQYEKWLAPVLSPTSQTNWTSSVEVTFWRRSWSW
jgi:Capsule assembly protein Wzi